MEEVWKDISITSLPNTPIPHIIHTIHHPTPSSHFRGTILQDFFNGRGGGERRNPPVRSFIVDSSPPPPPQSSQIRPNTQEFQFFENEMMNSQSHHQQFQNQGNSSVSDLMGLNDGVAAFDALASSAPFNGGVHHNIKKRFSDGGDDEDGSVDRRHKRMIKNRESAARSRARKQAYITELELEVTHLTEENARLRNQQRQLIEAPPTQLPKKQGLYRTSTAPF